MWRSTVFATIGVLAAISSVSAQTPTQSPTPPTSPAAAETPAGPEPMEEARLGDHWTYELRDDITGDLKSTITNTVTDVSDSEISTRSAVLGSPNFGYQTYDRSWNLINNGIWRYSPNDGNGIRAPLTVGKTWSFKSTDLNSTAGVSWKRSGTGKVLAQENVTTRAGTFDTFKVELSSQIQNANDPTKKFQAVIQVWYSPAINHWVKRSFVQRSDGRVRERSTLELVEYGRR